MTRSPPAEMKALVGRLVDPPQRPRRERDRRRAQVGVVRGRAQAREVLGGGRDPLGLQALREGGPRRADPPGLRAERPLLVGDEAAWPRHVQHRRQVHVDPVGGEAGPGGRALGAGGRGPAAAHLGGAHLGRAGRRFTWPPSWSIETSTGWRRPSRALGRLDRAGQPLHRALRADVVVEQDHARQLARGDHAQQAGGSAPAVEPADDPLPGELAGGEVGGCERLRRVGCSVDAGAIPPGTGHP